MKLKKTVPLVLFLALLSCMSGYLMSKPSLIGRIGIDLFYRQYEFLKIWWQGALAVFSALLVLLLIQALVHIRLPRNKANAVHVLFILLALGGLYYTWYDFHHTTTHRWLKERFHIGAYLFWLGWIAISVFHIAQKRISVITT